MEIRRFVVKMVDGVKVFEGVFGLLFCFQKNYVEAKKNDNKEAYYRWCAEKRISAIN